MSWVLSLIGKWKAWIVLFFSFLASLVVAVLYGYRKGKVVEEATQQKEKIDEAQQVVEQTKQATQERVNVDTSIEKLPNEGEQKVETANPDSAAGKLRSDWMRP